MIETFLKTLPFFGLVALGWAAARVRVFPDAATEWLSRFVFHFALSAMLFRFAATLPVADLFDPAFAAAYVAGTGTVYALAMAAGLARRLPLSESTIEAQCAAIGNTGFLGVPFIIALLGAGAAGPLLMVLTLDLAVFSSLFTLIVTAARGGAASLRLLADLIGGLMRNSMVVAIFAGCLWSLLALPLPGPALEFLNLLGNAATPCALFAIGASLAARSAERLSVALWLSAAKLALHPSCVAIAALLVFPVEPVAARVMIVAAALPVAGNVYILARQYGIAPRRVSAAILISTAASIVTLPLMVAWTGGGP